MTDDYPSLEEIERYCKPGTPGEYHTHDIGRIDIPKGSLIPWSDPDNIPDGWKLIPWDELGIDLSIRLIDPHPAFGDLPVVPVFDENRKPAFVMIKKL